MTAARKRVLIGVAWPYANGEKHIGQIAGAYLPAGIFARYQRLSGNDVLMVSGSDVHGTPVTFKAEARSRPGRGGGTVPPPLYRRLLETWPHLRPLHPYRHANPLGHGAQDVPAPPRTRPYLQGLPETALRPPGRALPRRPLPRGHLSLFIGKDNIPFHTIIWPGMLLASNRGRSNSTCLTMCRPTST